MMSGIFVSYAQLTNQDCLNAIPVCQNTYVQPNSYVGAGSDTSEINSALSCLNAGERNDVWYIFTVSVSGTLNFSIFPNNPNNDYDFALFNISNLGCNQIRDSANMEVACNFSANIPGCGGITGANGNTTGACALMNDNTVAVTAGQTYVLNVSNYSQTQQNGYTLDFSASSATIFDNIPPLLNTISALACGTDTLNLVFNENMLFSSFQPSDFTLTGPGGSYSITSITAPNCTNGSAYDKNYRFTFSPAITIGGTYTFSIVGNVTDICSNPIATPSTRTLNVAGITVNPSSTSVSCNGGNDGTATVNIITGTGPFSYQWSNNVSTTNTASNLPVGIYVVTVSAPNSCPATATYNITQAPSMTDSALVITPATCGANNGALNLFVTGGNFPYSYLWSNGSTSLNQSSLAAGNYTLTVTDNKNCTFSKMFTVGTLSTLNSVPQIQNINCYGDNTGSITLNTTGGSGNYTFQWAGGISTTNSVSNLTAGTYTATVMDGACLIVFNNLTITQPSLPLTATISSTQTTCGNTDGTATITNATGGSSPYSYSWNTGSTSMSISNLASGTYTCTVTDVIGCTVVKTTTVSPSNGHSVTISYLNDTVTCFGWSDGGVSLNVSGGVTPYTYQWSGGLPPNSSQNSLSAGTYTATVTDATGCSITVSATIESAPAINLNLVNSTNVLCYGSNTGTASVSASGGTGTLTYIWTPSGGTNASATNLAAGGYTVT
ncbi:MAG TPA: SprB repeat-containing protein, partial [Bacteroidia bacterium]|nr:SprB repeat-containing protein [Bacteroidia bacterium]